MRQKKIRRSWRKLYCLQLRLDINDKDLAKQTTNLKNYERFFLDTLGPVPGNLLAVERISWHAGKVLRPLLQFQWLFSLWGSLRILRVLNESSTMKIFASVLMKDIRVWLQPEVFVSENPILHFNERAWKSPHARKGDSRQGERTSRLSRVEWFSRALAFRSLYYPWGKMRD